MVAYRSQTGLELIDNSIFSFWQSTAKASCSPHIFPSPRGGAGLGKNNHLLQQIKVKANLMAEIGNDKYRNLFIMIALQCVVSQRSYSSVKPNFTHFHSMYYSG